jgi:3-isopropylmalate/(R)-2-methylmalate dehydratase small subunit
VLDDPATRIVVDLPNRAVRAPGLDEAFDIDEFTHWRLTEGLDDIGLSLRNEEKISEFEASRPEWLPTA